LKKLINTGNIGRYFSASEMLVGANALAGLSRLNAKRVLVLCSKAVFDRHNSYIKKCMSRFSAEFVTISGGEPTLDSTKNALKLSTKFLPDVIIGIGGGSVIDAAKLIWTMTEKQEIEFEKNRIIFPVSNLRTKCAGFVAVPTTYGSGSENSSSAVFQIDRKCRKSFLVGIELIPDIAVLDPLLAMDLPINLAVNGVMDAITHLVEGYVSKNSNFMLQNLSISALNIIKAQLDSYEISQIVISDESVKQLMAASTHAGVVQNIANPGLAHSLSHYCAKHGVPHGQSCGYFLPLSVRYNSNDLSVSTQYDHLSNGIGLKDKNGLINWLETLSNEFNLGAGIPLPNKLYENFSSIDFLNDPTVSTNPTTVDVDKMFEIMGSTYG